MHAPHSCRAISLALCCAIALLAQVPAGIAADCTITSNGKTYDLSGLTRTDSNWRAVDVKEKEANTYLINVCSQVVNEPRCTKSGYEMTASCLATDVKTGVSLGQVSGSSSLSMVDDTDNSQGVLLTYDSGENCANGGKHRTLIRFSCGVGRGEPVFVGSDGCVYNFEWSTDLVCDEPPPAGEQDCIAFDETSKNEYDLSPLIRTKTNWLAFDPSNPDMRYEINVCRPLVQTSDRIDNCQGQSACRFEESDSGQAYNVKGIGSPASPTITAEGIEISMSSDEDCPFGGKSGSRIEFVCDPTAGSGTPVVIDVVEGCFTVFQWRSTVACPLRDEKGANCQVTDELTGTTYDLTSLTKKSGSYEVDGGGYKYELNVCAAITGGSCSGGACQIHEGGTFSIGQANGNLELNDGDLTLTYTGGDDEACPQPRQTIISFSCNRNAHEPKPRFIDEKEVCIYRFEFETAAACPQDDDLIECSTIDESTGARYDLSELVRMETNWQVVTESGQKPFLINICRPLVRLGLATSCPTSAGACELEQSGTAYVGRHVGLPAGPVASGGVLEMLMPRVNDNSGFTKVVFGCGPRLGAPKLIGSLNGGEELISWETSAACPVNAVVGDSCKVTDPVDGTEFDLTSLMGNEYTVSTGDYQYKISLCEALHNSPCGDGVAACQLTPGSPSFHKSMGQATDALQLIERNLVLKYEHGERCHADSEQESLRSTVINFVCDNGESGENGPVFVEELDNCAYVFEWKTRLACDTPQVECVVEDLERGKIYDLTSLMRSDRNWQAGTDDLSTLFQINVCRGLVHALDENCPDSVAVCQQTAEDSFSAGKVAAPQIDKNSGQVFMEFEDGTTCANYGPRRTRIDFVCDESGAINSPRFIGESNCQYSFSWSTAAACPITKPSEEGCVVRDPYSQKLYNLTALSRPTGYTTKGYTDGTEYEYTLNVCSTLDSGCGDDKDAAACQTKESDKTFHKTTGRGPVGPELVDDQLILRYRDGEPCRNSKYQRQTVVTFYCDREAGIGAPIFEEETDACVYVFSWRTVHACAQFEQEVDCTTSAVVNGVTERFDLTPLANNRRNWIADDSAEQGKNEYQFNLCRPLVTGSHRCPASSGACWVSGGEDSNVDLGVGSAPEYDRRLDALVVTYTDGKTCNNGTEERTTELQLTCPPDSQGGARGGVLGEPVFAYGDECNKVFTWETSFACPLSAFSGSKCKVQDVRFGDTFDFSALTKRSGSYEVDTLAFSFYLNICGDIDIKGCEGAAACAVRKSDKDAFAIGMPSSAPRYDEGELSLLYKGGVECTDDVKWSTDILFQCDPKALPSDKDQHITYVYQSADDCRVSFVWRTSLACRAADSVECLVRDPSNGAEYDLSPLMRYDNNWLARDSRENNKYGYVINICRTLLPMPSYPDCGRHSAACQIGYRDNAFFERDLGHLAAPKLVDGQLFVEYEDGDKCGNIPRSTRIDFFCGSTLGEPIFQDETAGKCEYRFSWTTSAACSKDGQGPSLPGHDAGVCRVIDNQGNEYDLSPLSALGAVEATNENAGYTYTLSVCGGQVTCGDKQNVGACQEKKNTPDETYVLGMANDEPSILGTTVRLDYADGDPVGTGDLKRRVIINFVCDYTATDSKPEFVDETSDYVYVFRWRTNVVCQPAKDSVPCSVTNWRTGDTYDLSPLTRTSEDEGNWIANGMDYRYYINVCHNLLSVPGDVGDRCRGSAACQTKPSDLGFKNYSIGALNMRPQLQQDGTITLQYNGQSSIYNQPCGNGQIRTTFISFRCRKGSLGRPVFQYEQHCNYYFYWETSAACSQNVEVGENCQVEAESAGLRFDLSPLSGLVYDIPDGTGNTLTISACEPIPEDKPSSKGCAGLGSCRITDDDKVTSLGKASGAVEYADGELTLTYERGDVCDDQKDRAKTIIEFVCNEDADESYRPYAVWVDDCLTRVIWQTKHACRQRRESECVLVDDKSGLEYDLSPLVKTDGNWVAVRSGGDNYDYIINVCHALNPQVPETGCDEAAGICQIFSDNRINIGSVAPPEMKDGKLTMEYTNGDSDSCPNGMARSGTVTFECGESEYEGYELGRPKFVEESSTCDYEFTWKTPAACPFKRQNGKNCKIKDSVSGKTIDLTPLGKRSWHVYDNRGHQYYVNVCGSLSPPCESDKQSAVCQVASNNETYALGQANQDVTLTGDGVVMTFDGGDECSSFGHKERVSTVTFVCDPCALPGIKGPTMLQEDNCEYSFIWPTSLACLANERCDHPVTTPAPGPTGQPTKPQPRKGGSTDQSAIIAASISIGVVAVLVGVILLARRGFSKKREGFSIMANADDFDSDSDVDDF